MSRIEFLPIEIQRIIFEFDCTYLDFFRSTIIKEFKDNNFLFDKFIKLDRGFTIRNYEVKNWVIVPRYYDKNRNKIVGSYIRRLWRVTDPL
jgi:hypothetical protein